MTGKECHFVSLLNRKYAAEIKVQTVNFKKMNSQRHSLMDTFGIFAAVCNKIRNKIQSDLPVQQLS